MTFLDATKTWFLWNILVTNHLHVLLLKVLSKLYMLPVTTLAHGYIHWAASKGERQYPKSPQRRFVQPQYLFCSQIKSEKGTPTLTLVPTGRTHTHTHSMPRMLRRSVMSNSLWPHGLYPPGSSVHGILQARILEWVALLQGIFPIQESNLHLLHLLALAGGFFFF